MALKLLSWNDQPRGREKDAVDLAHILGGLGSMEAILDKVFAHPDPDLEGSPEDLDRRCRRWLGGRIAAMFGTRTRAMLS